MGETFAGIARRAEEGGFYSLWLMDHFLQIPGVGRPEQDMIEGYTGLGFAAGCTSRIKLGTMVTGATYRNPGVLIKAVTTLDVLSGGRAYFGVGAGWFEQEHRAFGIPFGTWTERFQKLEETLRIAHQMWDPENNGPFEGRHFRFAETLCVPQPVSKPHPRILIGGRGERKTLRFVAKYADAWNMGGGIPNEDNFADFQRLCAILRDHCDREGRRYDDIEKTVLFTFMVRDEAGGRWQTPQQTLDWLRRFRDAGLDQAIINTPNVDDQHTLGYLAENIVAPISSW
jgi:F420-dependent oxidoreductase-like protein